MNAYLIRCVIASRKAQEPASQLSGPRSLAPRGLIEGSSAEEVAQTSSRVKSLAGLAVGASLLVAICASANWRDREAALAAKTFEETAPVFRQAVSPSVLTDVILAAIPQIEEAADIIVGVENLHETDAPPRDPGATEIQVEKAAAAGEVPAAPAGDAQVAIPEVQVRVDGKAAFAPILKEARAPAMGTATGQSLAKPSPAESVTSLLRQGKQLLENGNVEAARDLFKDLAEAGVIDAAIALGSTYDPKSLAANGMTNVAPDPNKALLWYRRAHLLAESIARRERHPDRE